MIKNNRTSILDGSVWQLNSRKGRLVGTDQHGNEYYENTKYQQGRSRWVKYKDLDDYNPANVPREWHQWLHYISDEPDLTQEIKYEIPAIHLKRILFLRSRQRAKNRRL